MPESEPPQLALGHPPGELRGRPDATSKPLLRALLALQVVILCCVAALWLRPDASNRSTAAALAPGHLADLKQAALELEERSLDAQAARAWQGYLDADPQTPERAEILYRVGTLHLQAEQFDMAAAALVGAELAADDNGDLRAKIGRKLVECFRRLGRYGEVGRELSRQVERGAEATGQGRVLATLDGEPLTEADLDRMVERQVDQVFAAQGTSGDQATRRAMLRQFSTPDTRRQLLQQLIQSELFCRRARELKLDRDDEFLEARQLLEQSLLANRFLAGELKRIRATEVDVQSYYQANQKRYREPESAQVRLITLVADDDPTELLAGVQSADDFRKLASERTSQDSGGGQPQPRTIVRGRPDPLLGDVEPLFRLAEGQWLPKPVTHGDQKHLVLVEKKAEARTPPLSEIAARVEADYTREKRQELTQALFHDLMERYDVRIMALGEQDEERAEHDKESAETPKKEPEDVDSPARDEGSKEEPPTAKANGEGAS